MFMEGNSTVLWLLYSIYVILYATLSQVPATHYLAFRIACFSTKPAILQRVRSGQDTQFITLTETVKLKISPRSEKNTSAIPHMRHNISRKEKSNMTPFTLRSIGSI